MKHTHFLLNIYPSLHVASAIFDQRVNCCPAGYFLHQPHQDSLADSLNKAVIMDTTSNLE